MDEPSDPILVTTSRIDRRGPVVHLDPSSVELDAHEARAVELLARAGLLADTPCRLAG